MQIKTLRQLKAAANARKSVHVPSIGGWHRPVPAAYAMNYTGDILFRLFVAGMYLYKPANRG